MRAPKRPLVVVCLGLSTCTTWVHRPDDAVDTQTFESIEARVPYAEPEPEPEPKPDRVPVPVVEVEVGDDEPFVEIRSKLARRVYAAAKLIPEWAEWTGSDRLVIAEQKPGHPYRLQGALLDLDAGKRMQVFPVARHVAPQLGVAPITQPVGSTAPPDAVVHLDDGAIVHARAVLADGSAAHRPWVVSHERAQYLWVLGEDADGRLFGGRWKDPRRESVTLNVPLEMASPTWIDDPDYITRWREGLEVKLGVRVCEVPLERAEPDWPCARTRLERDGTASCVGRVAPACEPWYPDVVWSSFVDGSKIARLDEGWSVSVDSPLAARVLLSQPSSHGLRLALATPDAVVELPAVPADSSFALHDHYPVVWPLDLAWDPSTMSLLLDLERRKTYRLPRIRALHNGVALGRRTFLAREDADDGRLLFVDLEGPTVRVAADVSDCSDGVLQPLPGLGTRLAIACLGADGGRLRWSAVVDGAEGWVTRTRYRVEAVLPNGRILVSDRKGAGEAFASWFSWLDPQPRKSHGAGDR